MKKEIANVLAVREAVGHDMDLMIDPACELTTFGDALKVGWACDEAKFFWYEGKTIESVPVGMKLILAATKEFEAVNDPGTRQDHSST